MGLSQIPETPPYLGIWRTTDYLCWVVVRAEGHVIGVEYWGIDIWRKGVVGKGFFSQGGVRAEKHDS